MAKQGPEKPHLTLVGGNVDDVEEAMQMWERMCTALIGEPTEEDRAEARAMFEADARKA